MANKQEIKAESRGVEGKGASRRLRHAGKIPAVLYGAKQAPQNIQLEQISTQLLAQNEWFYSSILELNLDGKVQKVLLRDIQRHPFKSMIMHLDFQRVSETEKLRLSVPLHFLNQEKSPAGKTVGVVITHELNEVEIYCLPKHIPEFIEVDLSTLEVGDIVHMSSLKLGADIEIPALKLGKEHDLALVIARMQKAEVEATADGAAADVPASKVAAPAKGAAPARCAGARGAAKAAPAKKK
ncbi:MAG: 50S ribosomal protein L25/general stress protein Ctc [Rhodanobacteraceae bacterium]|nr:50S ribosomal protein L25/general stress protein Ctc [Rhodanobacteraceae bacterium]